MLHLDMHMSGPNLMECYHVGFPVWKPIASFNDIQTVAEIAG